MEQMEKKRTLDLEDLQVTLKMHLFLITVLCAVILVLGIIVVGRG